MRNQPKVMSFDSILARLETSVDATDRVKAAAELGEVGTPEVAPILLKVAWEDSQSGVRQAAITSYAEIMKNDAVPELKRAVETHFDSYVRLNALSMLVTLDDEVTLPFLKELIKSSDEKIRSLAIRELFMKGASEMAPLFLEALQTETYSLAQRNLLEALAIWKYHGAEPAIREILDNARHDEIQIVALFALSVFGDNGALAKLKEIKIDSYFRIKYNDHWYRGKEGLLKLIDRLK